MFESIVDVESKEKLKSSKKELRRLTEILKYNEIRNVEKTIR